MIFQFVENGGGLPATITTVSGTVAVNSPFMRGITRLVYAKAATATTTFDFKITDAKSRIVKQYTTEEGTLRDFNILALQGKYTLTIENASNDETFDVYLMIQEQPK